MVDPSSPNQEGPDDVPPPLPEGWLAQWDGKSRKYYYVQRATGHSQWEVPTKPALSAPTPEPTPQGIDPFGKPIDTNPAPDADYAGQDRSLLGDLASSALGGGKQNDHASGLGGLAQTLLSGGSKPSNSHTPTNIGGQLLSSFLGGKPHGDQNTQSGYQNNGSHGGQGQSSTSNNASGGGLIGGIGGFLHSHHGAQQNSNFGYNPGQSSGSGYSGQAPPATYTPGNASGAYGPSSGPYQPFGSNTQMTSTPTAQRPSQANHPTAPYDNQSTPQPYNPAQPAQSQQYQSPPSSQYHGSNPPTPAYSQSNVSYASAPPADAGFGTYSQPNPGQTLTPSFPPPPSQPGAIPGYASVPGNGAQNFPPPPSGLPPSYYQGQPQQSQQPQQQQQPHIPQLDSGNSFPPPPSQYRPQGSNLPSPYQSTQNMHQQSQGQAQTSQSYVGSPAPPMHSHPNGQGFPNAPSSSHGNPPMGNYGSQAPNPPTYGAQSSDPYSGNYSAPAAPSWR